MSQLATQLQKLRLHKAPGVADGAASSQQLSSGSFLFSKSDARSYSRDQILELAKDGLRILLQHENKFQPFAKALFTPEVTRRERALLTAEENGALNAVLEPFLVMLSPHLFLTAAHQVLEFLIRVHEVHVYNREALLRAFLPYHDHNIFSRILLIMDLRDTGFDFLSSHQDRATPLLRRDLLIGCTQSRKALQLVCQSMLEPIRLHVYNGAANALFASVVTGVADASAGAVASGEKEVFWRQILPVVVECLSASPTNGMTSLSLAQREGCCTALIVWTVWSSAVQFSAPMLATLLKPLIRMTLNPSESDLMPVTEWVMLLDVLCCTQKELQHSAAFSQQLALLLTLPWKTMMAPGTPLADAAAAAAATPSARPPLAALLRVLVSGSLVRLTAHQGDASLPTDISSFLITTVYHLPLEQSLVVEMIETLMRVDSRLEEGSSAASTDLVQKLLHGLESRFPQLLDRVLSESLERADEISVCATHRFLARHLSGSRYQLIDGGAEAGGVSLPLFAALLHPAAPVRQRGADVLMKALPTITRDGDLPLLELLAHTMEYESNESVAKCFLAAAAQPLLQFVSEEIGTKGPSSSRRSEEEEDKAPHWRLAERLLESCAVLGLSKPALMASYAGSVLDPLLQLPAVRSYVQQPEPSATRASFTNTIVYHAVLLQTVATNGGAEQSLPAMKGLRALFADFKPSGSIESLFQCSELLRVVASASQRRLQKLFANATALINEEEEKRYGRTHVEVECALAAGCVLWEELRNSRSPSAGASQVLRLLSFLIGDNLTRQLCDTQREAMVAGMEVGYLQALQTAQRKVMRKTQHSTSERLGRGAVNSRLTSPYLPTSTLTTQLATSFQGAVQHALRDFPDVDVVTLQHSLLLLPLVGAPLPCVMEGPHLLPYGYLRMLPRTVSGLDELEELFHLQLYLQVHRTLFRAEQPLQTPATTSSGKKKSTPAPASQEADDTSAAAWASHLTPSRSWGALCLLLCFPLCAPDSIIRHTHLKELQSALLRAKPSASVPLVRLLTAVRRVLPAEVTSITALSAIVESLEREESRYHLTSAARQLLASGVAATWSGDECSIAFVIPRPMAVAILTHFFSPPTSYATAASHFPLELVYPSVKALLAKHSTASQDRSRSSAATSYSISTAAADYIGAVCERSLVLPPLSAEAPAVQLVNLLLAKPYLHVLTSSSSTTTTARPLYPFALTMLALALQPLDGGVSTSTGGLIFRRSASKKRRGGALEALCQEDVASLTAMVAPSVWSGVTNIGSDVSRLVVGTRGGVDQLFLSFLSDLKTARAEQSASSGNKSSYFKQLEVLTELLELLEPSQATAAEDDNEEGAKSKNVPSWQPPADCVAHNALSYGRCVEVVDICVELLQPLTKGSGALTAARGRGGAGLPEGIDIAIRLLIKLLRCLPVVAFEDEDEETSGKTMCTLVHDEVLKRIPFTLFLPLLEVHDDDEVGLSKLSGTAMLPLQLLREEVTLCLDSRAALCEQNPNGATMVHSILLQEGLTVMTSLLLAASPEEEEQQKPTSEPTDINSDASRARVDCLTEVLRALSPLLAPDQRTATPIKTSEEGEEEGSEAAAPIFLLHVPIAGLLVRLSTVGYTAALGYRSAVEVCQELIAGFDIYSQIKCLTELMRLLQDPTAVLRASDDADEESAALVKLYRKLVKPNQVVNRQELLLQVVNLTIKSEGFLSRFIELQYRHDKKGVELTTQLLTNSLSLYAHYSVAVENFDAEVSKNGAADEDGDESAYLRLLELLAGNALACVLAGINESTFVDCLRTLLSDVHVSVQLRGLQILLDRLHHALPTLEETISDEEMEAYRQRIRDPKVKLSLMDLVRVKARPLTTKRSFNLHEQLCARLEELLALIVEDPAAASTCELHVEERVTLILACLEELIRIVGSGGSTQAEKTLLNANRNHSVAESTLVKLFGKRSQVDVVHKLVHNVCSAWLPQLQKAATQLPTQAAAIGGVMSAMLIFLGSVAPVMGSAFLLTHCQEVLEALVGCGLFNVHPARQSLFPQDVFSVLRYASLTAVLRCFPACWHMSQPFLSTLVYLATHNANMDNPRTLPLCRELLAVLTAVMEPQVLLRAAGECLWGFSSPAKAEKEATENKKGAAAARTLSLSLETHSITAFFEQVLTLVERLSRDELLELPYLTSSAQEVKSNMWLAALQLLSSAANLPPSSDILAVQNAFSTFFIKFKPRQCNQFLSHIAVWSFGPSADASSSSAAAGAQGAGKRRKRESKTEGDGDNDEERGHADGSRLNRSGMHRWILFYSLYDHLLQKLGTIFDFSYSVMMPYVIEHLRRFDGSSSGAAAEGTKALGSRVVRFLEMVLSVVRRISEGCTPGPDYDYSVEFDSYLVQGDVFQNLMPPLVHQISNAAHLTDDGPQSFRYRVEETVIPCIRAFFNALNASPALGSKLQAKTQGEVLRMLRHTDPQVRRLALLTLDGLYADGGEELASRLMAEMLPPVVEMSEDRNEEVVEASRELCMHLSTITGQDVLHAMSG